MRLKKRVFIPVRAVHFPDELIVDFAVCVTRCGWAGFLLRGQGFLLCDYCGTKVQVVASRSYMRKPSEPAIKIDESIEADAPVWKDGSFAKVDSTTQ